MYNNFKINNELIELSNKVEKKNIRTNKKNR